MNAALIMDRGISLVFICISDLISFSFILFLTLPPFFIYYKQMTKRMTMQEKFAAKRWYMVGAYQAGATEKAISDMVGLSPASVHNVITQFKKTGSPIRKRLSLAEKSNKEK